MPGFGPFLSKELRETARTWRIWVLPGMLLFFALSSPVLALLTPALLKSIAASQPGLVIRLPPPSAADALQQFLKNLTQLGSLALVFTTAGAVSGEVRAGTAILALSKPLTRASFVVAKAVAHALLLCAALALAAALCGLETLALFGPFDAAAYAASLGAWLLFALVLMAGVLLASALWNAQVAAAGAGLGLFAVLAILGSWGAARAHTPAGLQPLAWELLAGRGTGAAAAWPLATGAVTAAALLAAAVLAFRRREL